MTGPDSEARARALHAISAMRAALQRMMASLEGDIAFTSSVLAGLSGDGSIAHVLDGLDTAGARQHLTDTINELEAKRLDARRQLFRAMIDEGASIGDVARTWGISRQLASRIINDPG